MKKTFYISTLVLLLSVVLVPLSCRKADMSTFDGVIGSGGDFGSIEYSEEREETGESETRNGNEIWTCTTTKISIKDALGGENGFSLFSPNANVVYPGNLIQGKSLYKATPDGIPADRAGGTITISLLDGSDISSVDVDKIELGQVTEAANLILRDKNAESVIPANFQYERSIVQSEREFALKIKADYNNAWASVSGKLSFSSNQSYSRMMVTLHQTFYTLSFTEPFRVEDFFAPTADPEDLERFTGPGNPMCYISSVNYGRIFYMLVESSSSESDLKAAVNAAFETPTSSGGGSVAISELQKLEEVNIKVFALGGNAAVTQAAAGLSKNNLHLLNDILVKATDIRTGVPVSYKVQSVATNEVVAVQLATDYDRKTCYVTSALPPPVITEHWTGMREMLGAPVGAAVKMLEHLTPPGKNRYIAFFDSLGQRCVLDDGERLHGPYDNFEALYKEYYNIDVKIPLEDIGAGEAYTVRIANLTFSRQILVNRRGNRCVEVINSNYSKRKNISEVPELEYFSTEGISALCNGEWGILTVDKSHLRMHIEPYGGGDPLLNLFPTALMTGGVDNKFPNGISAITRLGENLYASIERDGRTYMVADLRNSQNPVYWGPFKL